MKLNYYESTKTEIAPTIHLRKTKTYLIIPVNFSRTDLGPTHIISAEAILAITLVT